MGGLSRDVEQNGEVTREIYYCRCHERVCIGYTDCNDQKKIGQVTYAITI